MTASFREVEIIPLKSEHLNATFEWLQDPGRRMQIDSLDEPVLERHIEVWNKRLKDESRRDFAICLEGRHVGNCGLHSIDPKRKKAELWIYVSAPAKGIGSRAVNQLLKFGFDELGLNRIFLRVVSDNPAAANFYEKLGFQREGVFRADTIHNGKPVDSQLYAMLRNEFAR